MSTTGDAIAWDVAERVATLVAGRAPSSASYHYDSLQPDFDELTAVAEELVAEETGLRSSLGPARAVVTDRPGWVHANVSSFQRLLRPLTEHLAPKIAASFLAPASRAVSGAELGALLGWMSTRVLGQYDLLLVEEENPADQDIVYFVGPNVVAIEKRFDFPPRQFRLWLAIHEVTHRAQFTGIDWMRPHFLSLVDRALSGLGPDPRLLLDGLRRAARQIRAGENPLAEGGLVGLLAGPEQHQLLRQVQALMSLLEGHGDVTMDRAGAAVIPEAGEFSAALKARRAQMRGPARLLAQIIGLEAKMRQYEQGERFIEAVEREAGREVMDLVWRGPEWLPSFDELGEPALWVSRVSAPAAAGDAPG
ncbi:MAG: zinc-dependent metalloprotease [Acidimicrobiales bacterium]